MLPPAGCGEDTRQLRGEGLEVLGAPILTMNFTGSMGKIPKRRPYGTRQKQCVTAGESPA